MTTQKADICPVCNRGRLVTKVDPDDYMPPQTRTVSHLACVSQANKVMRLAVEANARLSDELATLEEACITREQHNNIVAQREAELAALKGRIEDYGEDDEDHIGQRLEWVADCNTCALRSRMCIVAGHDPECEDWEARP